MQTANNSSKTLKMINAEAVERWGKLGTYGEMTMSGHEGNVRHNGARVDTSARRALGQAKTGGAEDNKPGVEAICSVKHR